MTAFCEETTGCLDKGRERDVVYVTLAGPLTWSPAVSSWPNWKHKDKVGQKLAGPAGPTDRAEQSCSSWLQKWAGSDLPELSEAKCKVLHLEWSNPVKQDTSRANWLKGSFAGKEPHPSREQSLNVVCQELNQERRGWERP